MPSGRTHDAITLFLAAPTFVAGYSLTSRISAASVVTAAFLFGGLMFGPDLDTVSRQYSRWSIFRFLWTPYRGLFRHRSRFSHGLIFGSLIRVVYFNAILALVVFAGMYLWASVSGGHLPDLMQMSAGLVSSAYRLFGEHSLLLAFIGVWIGAASHTFTDMAGSFVKTGRVTEFL